METYKTIREAAIVGTRQAIKLAQRDGWEYGGVVLYNGDEFYVSDIVTQKSDAGVDLETAYPKEFQVPRLSKEQFADFRKKVVAFFHVHVPYSDGTLISVTDMFSGQDVVAAIRLRTLAYLGDGENGDVYELDASTQASFKATTTELEVDKVGIMTVGPDASISAKGTKVYDANPKELRHAA